MNPQHIQLTDFAKVLGEIFPQTANANGRYVSMKNYARATLILLFNNGTTVTGGTVTLTQATDVSGTGAKALPFTGVRQTIDAAAASGDILTDAVVASNQFVSDTTNSKQLVYVIELNEEQLDHVNNFDCFRVNVTGQANTTYACVAILHPARYGSPVAIAATID